MAVEGPVSPETSHTERCVPSVDPRGPVLPWIPPPEQLQQVTWKTMTKWGKIPINLKFTLG